MDPLGYLTVGVTIQVIGGALLGFGTDSNETPLVVLGMGLLGIGSIVTLIGAIAMGVVVGIRHRDVESADV